MIKPKSWKDCVECAGLISEIYDFGNQRKLRERKPEEMASYFIAEYLPETRNPDKDGRSLKT